MERFLTITVADHEGTVVDLGYVRLENADGDARDAAAAVAQAAEGIELLGMPADWEPGVDA